MNGIGARNLQLEVQRLLYLTGEYGGGDRRARELIDQMVADYNALKKCNQDFWDKNPFTNCNLPLATKKASDSASTTMGYLNDNLYVIFANLAAAPENGEDVSVRFDRSRGLFHPNQKGHNIQACQIRTTYAKLVDNCLTEEVPIADIIRAEQNRLAPVAVGDGTLPVVLHGFAPGQPVQVVMNSKRVDLGVLIADGNGTVAATLTLPGVGTVGAGAHTIEFDGSAVGGVALTKEVRVDYPGRPVGGASFQAYMCCFDAPADHDVPLTPGGTADLSDSGADASIVVDENGNIVPLDGRVIDGAVEDADEPPSEYVQIDDREKIDIIYHGDVLSTEHPDADGGVFVSVPVYDVPIDSGPVTITARSRRTGKEVTTTIDPISSVAALWATSREAGALVLTGSKTSVTGLVHSNSDVTLKGSSGTLSTGTEYATDLIVRGNGHSVPNARQIAPGWLPATVQVADYRPGGSRAVAGGASYHAIPAQACATGRWTADAASVPAGIVYVPCAVTISGSGRAIDAIIVAEGDVTISGSSLVIGQGVPGQPAVVSGAVGADAIHLSGSGVQVNGTMQALGGSVAVTGSGTVLRCGVIADTIRIAGSTVTIISDSACIATD